ncbi:MAG: dUTP diphosphatase [Aristaeellaceae bacterium]
MTIARFSHVSPGQYAAKALPTAMPLAEIPLPRRATAGSAGYDFVCPVDVTLAPGEAVTIPTGIRCEMQPGWVLLLFPRSGLGFRHQLRLANTVGVIDSDYFHAGNEGHILVRIVNGQLPSDENARVFRLSAGERFCQGVFLPHGLAEEDEVQASRVGGFGSTGSTGKL